MRKKHRIMLVAFVYVAVAAACIGAQDISNAIDVQTLSELSIEQLLSVKHEFQLPLTGEDKMDSMESREDSDNSSSVPAKGPIAMGLRRSKPKPLNRGGWEDEKGKKGIGSIFQISITTLAFLAFGGYLLCLIVQSLKDKGGYQKKIIVITPSSTAAPVTMAAFRRRRRRPVRIRRPQRQKRDTNGNGDDAAGPTVDMTPHIDTIKMFDALVSLSEAYTRYHTVDYRRFNQTIIHF